MATNAIQKKHRAEGRSSRDRIHYITAMNRTPTNRSDNSTDDLSAPAVLDELPIDNLPLLSQEHGPYTIEGWSRAAVQSYWRIRELKLLFDIGGSPWAFMGTPTVCVSHAHLDHLAALPQYVARRRMMKMTPPRVFLPTPAVEPTERMLRSWQKLDRGRMTVELVGVPTNEEICDWEYSLSRELVLTAFPTRHTVPSVGFIVWERRKKLKEKYQGLTGEEIRDLRYSGVDVAEERRTPIVCYTGDTSSEGLDADPAIYEAKILITEMSFFRKDHRRDKIKKFGHMHLDDIVDRADRFQNEKIILSHLSTRTHYKPAQRALDKRLPEELRQRVHLWVG